MSQEDPVNPQPLDSVPPELQQALDTVQKVMASMGTAALCSTISSDAGEDHGVFICAVGMPVNMAADVQDGLNAFLQELMAARLTSSKVFGKDGLPSTPMDNAAQNLARALLMQHEKGGPTALSLSLRIPNNPELSVIVAAALTQRSKVEGGFYRELDAVMQKWIGPGHDPQAEPT